MAMNQAHTAESMAKTYMNGDIVFAEGSEGQHMYLIVSGQVEISRSSEGRKTVLSQLGPGEMFGEMALVDSGLRTADAVAVVDGTRIMAINQGYFVYLVSQQPAFALSLMRVMSQRIVKLSEQIAAMKGAAT